MIWGYEQQKSRGNHGFVDEHIHEYCMWMNLFIVVCFNEMDQLRWSHVASSTYMLEPPPLVHYISIIYLPFI